MPRSFSVSPDETLTEAAAATPFTPWIVAAWARALAWSPIAPATRASSPSTITVIPKDLRTLSKLEGTGAGVVGDGTVGTVPSDGELTGVSSMARF